MIISPAAPQTGLVWFAEHGVGYLEVTAGPGVYDLAYWNRYLEYDASPMGDALTAARVAQVNRRWTGAVIDVGIGGGAFVRARGQHFPTYGTDVNPHAIEWLEANELHADPLDESLAHPVALTFWDCLEHIPEPDPLLARATWVFASLPIFTGPDHVLRSRHFRRDEHCWYFTRDGFVWFMALRGFRCVEHSTAETILGREDIGSFSFVRHGFEG